MPLPLLALFLQRALVLQIGTEAKVAPAVNARALVECLCGVGARALAGGRVSGATAAAATITTGCLSSPLLSSFHCWPAS